MTIDFGQWHVSTLGVLMLVALVAVGIGYGIGTFVYWLQTRKEPRQSAAYPVVQLAYDPRKWAGNVWVIDCEIAESKDHNYTTTLARQEDGGWASAPFAEDPQPLSFRPGSEGAIYLDSKLLQRLIPIGNYHPTPEPKAASEGEPSSSRLQFWFAVGPTSGDIYNTAKHYKEALKGLPMSWSLHNSLHVPDELYHRALREFQRKTRKG